MKVPEEFRHFFISFKKMFFKMSNPYQIVSSEFTQRYINLVDQMGIQEALKTTGKSFRKLLKNLPEYKHDYTYATDKWTLKDVVQHVIDAERVFSFRAVSFARKDPALLPSFEEKEWATSAHASTRDWDEMLDEFRNLRKSTRFLFASFLDYEMDYQGTANNSLISVAAIGYLCSGHLQHHINIINERYL